MADVMILERRVAAVAVALAATAGSLAVVAQVKTNVPDPVPAARPAMVERVVYVGSIMQLIIRLAPGETIQAWVQNQGTELPFQQGTPVMVHMPPEALRVLFDPGDSQQPDARSPDSTVAV